MVQQLDEAGVASDKVWSCIRRLFDTHTIIYQIDLETAIKVRNIVIKRFADDKELIKRAENDVVAILFNFSLFNKT